MGTRSNKKKSAVKKPADKPNHAPTAWELGIEEKKNLILDMRERGASIRDISKHFQDNGIKGSALATIHKHLVNALEDMLTHRRMKVKHVVQLELNKIDRVESAHFRRLLTSVDADSIEKLSRAMERVWRRRDALLGLHKPLKVQIDPRETLAKLLGTKPEDLPNGDSDS